MEPGSVRVTMDLPADLASGVSAGELADEARGLLVLERLKRRELSATRAARILGVDRLGFLDLCAQHEVPVLRYEHDDFERELADLRAMGR